MQKPSTWNTGVAGTVGTAAQTVSTTKYSVCSAALCPKNKYGDRYVRVDVKCDKVFTIYFYGSSSAMLSTTNSGSDSGKLIVSYSGNAATALDGQSFYIPIAGFHYFLPVLYQAAGTDATVTLSYQTFNP